MMKNPLPGSPSYWIAYVLVDEVTVATRNAESFGATICKGGTVVPGFGRFSVITDPAGATLALWQMNPNAV